MIFLFADPGSGSWIKLERSVHEVGEGRDMRDKRQKIKKAERGTITDTMD